MTFPRTRPAPLRQRAVALSRSRRRLFVHPDLGLAIGAVTRATRLLRRSQSAKGLTITSARLRKLVRTLPLGARAGQLRIVALGCGDGYREIQLARRLPALGIRASLVAVDLSRPMLRLCLGIASDKKVECVAIEGDFLRDPLRTLLDRIALTYPRLFSILGGTFGNYHPMVIIPALHRMTRPGDLVMIETAMLSGNRRQDARIRKRYGRPNKSLEESLWPGLAAIGITKDNATSWFREISEKELPLPVATYGISTTRAVRVGAQPSPALLVRGTEATTLELRVFSRRSLSNAMHAAGFSRVADVVGQAVAAVSVFRRH